LLIINAGLLPSADDPEDGFLYTGQLMM